MKKLMFIALLGATANSAWGAAQQWPLGQAGSPFAGWAESWANFNKQMADLAAMKDTLPQAARPELEEALEAADALTDAASNIESFSTSVSMVNGKVVLNGKPIKATGSKFALINGVLFLDDKEVDPVTGDFKAGAAAKKPADVGSAVRRTTTTRLSARARATATRRR